MTDDRQVAESYIESLAEPRRSQVRRLHDVILTALPDIDVTMYDYGGPLIGYGSYDYANSRRPAGRWFSVGLASRKAYISLYAMGTAEGRYLVEGRKDDFPGARAQKSCLNMTVPERVPDEAVASLARDCWTQFKDGFRRPDPASRKTTRGS